MKIGIFTGNQPRHLALVRAMAEVADEVCLVQECKTVHTGIVADRIAATDVMATYFGRMQQAERDVFGSLDFSPPGVRHLAIRHDDLSRLDAGVLRHALNCDHIIVFGTSYIRGAVCDALVERRALNIHLGISPYYRGSACNFWALHDGRADLVGATVHNLSRGLDSGDILFHALPKAEDGDPFRFGMYAARAVIRALQQKIAEGSLAQLRGVPQDRSRELRYSRNADFNDDVAAQYLSSPPVPETILASASARDMALYVHPTVQ